MYRACIITCSDAASRGERVDRSGPAVRDLLRDAGYETSGVRVVADEIDSIAATIVNAVDSEQYDLVVTTGGTGLAPRDVTPEATARVSDRLVPGFGELMRLRSLEKTAMAPLSRAQAATRGRALIVNLPGSVSGATENLAAVLHLIPHALELLRGGRVERHPEGTKPQ